MPGNCSAEANWPPGNILRNCSGEAFAASAAGNEASLNTTTEEENCSARRCVGARNKSRPSPGTKDGGVGRCLRIWWGGSTLGVVVPILPPRLCAKVFAEHDPPALIDRKIAEQNRHAGGPPALFVSL